jgi:hypothetical protein
VLLTIALIAAAFVAAIVGFSVLWATGGAIYETLASKLRRR